MNRVNLPLLLNTFGEIELIHAISLRLFRREISASSTKASLSLFRKDIENGILSVKPVPTAAFERAKQLARKRTPSLGTRTLDILHVASALVLQSTTFLTFDTRQAGLARAEGLSLR